MRRPVALGTPGPADLDPLAAAAALGDRTALQDLLCVVEPLIVRYCRARVGPRHPAADDVARRACLAVLGPLHGYPDDRQPFLAVVYAAAARAVTDAWRRGLVQGAAAHPPGSNLEMLPPEQREILILRVVAGLSADETAAAVGSPVGAVRIAQHRALTRLRATP